MNSKSRIFLPSVELTFWQREGEAIKNKHCKEFTSIICYMVISTIEKDKTYQVKECQTGEGGIWSKDEEVSLVDIWGRQGQHIWSTVKKVKVAQSCPTLCDPMDYTVHGILQARILEWVALPFSRGSSQPRDQMQVSHIAGGFFTSCATGKVQECWSEQPILSPADLPNPGVKRGSPELQAVSLPTESLREDQWDSKMLVPPLVSFIAVFHSASQFSHQYYLFLHGKSHKSPHNVEA